MKTKIQKLPKWFTGTHYTNGETVTNPFSEESYELNNLELSMYDFIMGAQMMLDMGLNDKSILTDFHKGLDWFRTNNAEGYRILLD